MEIIKTKIDGVVIVEPKVFGDHRGFFMESWSKRTFEEVWNVGGCRRCGD